jgi:ABC-type dipeptide/oligopeptide/nickel transport system permease subunit
MVKRAALGAVLVLTAAALGAPWLAPADPARQHRDEANLPPGSRFPLGSDEFGRDLLSRLLHAGRWSLAAGALAVSCSLGLGTALGLIASYTPRTV